MHTDVQILVYYYINLRMAVTLHTYKQTHAHRVCWFCIFNSPAARQKTQMQFRNCICLALSLSVCFWFSLFCSCFLFFGHVLVLFFCFVNFIYIFIDHFHMGEFVDLFGICIGNNFYANFKLLLGRAWAVCSAVQSCNYG